MSEVMVVGANQFAAEVIEYKELPVLVDFWAPWCGYCTKLLPLLDELAGDLTGKVRVVKVNVDENRELAQQYGVMSLPTLMIFKNGEQVEKFTGFLPKAELSAKVQPHL
ncbi:thioredoxin [Azotosporobacter soli]|uniref:thioredoxin n=1 Tax=Azotosporobacter soli TaxID=3055040 RepID=UPI0031FEFCE3